jgi:hypothetical protein
MRLKSHALPHRISTHVKNRCDVMQQLGAPDGIQTSFSANWLLKEVASGVHCNPSHRCFTTRTSRSNAHHTVPSTLSV